MHVCLLITFSTQTLLDSLEICRPVFVSHKWFRCRRSDGRKDETGGETAICQEGAATEKGGLETCVRLFYPYIQMVAVWDGSNSICAAICRCVAVIFTSMYLYIQVVAVWDGSNSIMCRDLSLCCRDFYEYVSRHCTVW